MQSLVLPHKEQDIRHLPCAFVRCWGRIAYGQSFFTLCISLIFYHCQVKASISLVIASCSRDGLHRFSIYEAGGMLRNAMHSSRARSAPRLALYDLSVMYFMTCPSGEGIARHPAGLSCAITWVWRDAFFILKVLTLFFVIFTFPRLTVTTFSLVSASEASRTPFWRALFVSSS